VALEMASYLRHSGIKPLSFHFHLITLRGLWRASTKIADRVYHRNSDFHMIYSARCPEHLSLAFPLSFPNDHSKCRISKQNLRISAKQTPKAPIHIRKMKHLISFIFPEYASCLALDFHIEIMLSKVSKDEGKGEGELQFG
jgi:hypothetical protein